MKNRLLLCLLISSAIIYIAVPSLSFTTDTLHGVYSLVWISFGIIVIGGNLVGLLYLPKNKSSQKVRLSKNQVKKVKQYQ